MEDYGDRRMEEKGNLGKNVRKKEGEKRELGKEERGGKYKVE